MFQVCFYYKNYHLNQQAESENILDLDIQKLHLTWLFEKYWF